MPDNLENKFTIQTDENISSDNYEIRVAFYANIGFFIQVAQALEFNLRKLLCYHKSVTEIKEGTLTKERVESICKNYDDYYVKTYKDKFTLGKLKNELKCISVLTDDIHKIFTEINDYRALVVHQLFQNNFIIDSFKKSKDVKDYMENRLIPMTNKTKVINDFVINIINTYKEDLHKYKDEVGIEYSK
jgi:hypothetical protein